MSNTNDIRLIRAYDSLQGLSVGDAFVEKFFLHPDVAENIIASRAIPALPWYYTDDTQRYRFIGFCENMGKLNKIH